MRIFALESKQESELKQTPECVFLDIFFPEHM